MTGSVIGMAPRRRHADQDTAGRHEAGDVVDMTVRLVVGEAFAEPDHPPRPGIERQPLLDLLAVEMGIAVRIEQALFGW